DALRKLKSGTPEEKLGALEALAAATPDREHQVEVLLAAGPFAMETNKQFRDVAERVKQKWFNIPLDVAQQPNGGGDRKPGDGRPPPEPEKAARDLDTDALLARLGPGTPGHQRQEAVRELARRKETRAAAPIARLLADGAVAQDAFNALRDLGGAVEKEVLPYMHHPDPGTRDRARSLLKGYVTGNDVLRAQTVKDLESADLQRRRSAIDWLALVPAAGVARSDAIRRALEQALDDNDEGLRASAIRALGN